MASARRPSRHGFSLWFRRWWCHTGQTLRIARPGLITQPLTLQMLRCHLVVLRGFLALPLLCATSCVVHLGRACRVAARQV